MLLNSEEMRKETISLTLTANAGILLIYGGKKLLIDSLYQTDASSREMLSDLRPYTLDALMNGTPPYNNMDTLLFTHTHADHFSPALTLSYLQKQQVSRVLLPPDDGRQQALRAFLAEREIPWVSLETTGRGGTVQLGENFSVTVFPTRHVDRAFWATPHYCCLVRCGEKRLFFTSDVDYTVETFSQLADIPLHALFVNPLFFAALHDRRLFQGELRAETVCIYHVPFPEDDTRHYREFLRRSMARWKPEYGNLCLMEQPEQRLIL